MQGEATPSSGDAMDAIANAVNDVNGANAPGGLLAACDDEPLCERRRGKGYAADGPESASSNAAPPTAALAYFVNMAEVISHPNSGKSTAALRRRRF